MAVITVQVKPNVYKATGAGQPAATANQPLLRLPPRFASAF